ncbi:hypothetical protein Tco_0339897 [Tanacetum coccineum]
MCRGLLLFISVLIGLVSCRLDIATAVDVDCKGLIMKGGKGDDDKRGPHAKEQNVTINMNVEKVVVSGNGGVDNAAKTNQPFLSQQFTYDNVVTPDRVMNKDDDFQSVKRKTSKGSNWESQGKHQGSGFNKSTNDSYRPVVKPKYSTPVSNPFFAFEEDNGNSTDDLVDDTRKKVGG